MAASSSVIRNAALAVSGITGLSSGAYLFHNLTDFSQAVITRHHRNDFMAAWNQRHKIATIGMGGILANTAIYWSGRLRRGRAAGPVWAWAAWNGVSLGLWYGGYLNPEVMLRPRNHNALYVSTCQAAKLLKDSDMCVVTQLDDQEPVCYPDQQILRPHMVDVGTKSNGTPATICYCGLTGTGVVYETPPLPDGRAREFVPITQLRNNLMILDKATGHFGHQINGLDETRLLDAMGETNYDKVGKRLPLAELEKLGVEPAKEVPSWRMTARSFREAYPLGKVFINDYREFPSIVERPILTIYDKIIDTLFDQGIGKHNTSDFMLFPTVDKLDKRLPLKQRVWGFNVGDDFACLTEDFVKEGKNGVRNFVLGGVPLVASYDEKYESLGIFKRQNNKAIASNVDVYGKVAGAKGKNDIKLERLDTVKAGLFWFVWQDFFPDTSVNPEA